MLFEKVRKHQQQPQAASTKKEVWKYLLNKEERAFSAVTIAEKQLSNILIPF
jgi:hypothetical protein